MSLNPHDIFAQVEQVADAVDRHFEAVFSSIKSSFENSQWIPQAVRPLQKAAPAPSSLRLGYLQRAERWLDDHRAIVAAVVAFTGTTTFLLWQGRLRSSSSRRKRRARRGAHGAKVEAVVLAGPPESPLTKIVAHDLERRGFLVYIPIASAADEQLVKTEARDGIRPLHLDLSSQATISSSLTSFTNTLAAATRSQPVHLASLIVVPALDRHPNLPLSAISSDYWTTNLYIHLQRPIDLIHAFLPLLQAQTMLQPRPTATTTTTSSSQPPSLPPTSIVVLSRGITSALPLPNHGTEAVSHAALAAYLRTLKAEHAELSISHLQLGAIDLGAHAEGRGQLVLHPRSRSSSPPDALSVLGRLGRPDLTPARRLHDAIFDAVVGRTTGTAFVGRGARTYALVGRYSPVALIRWMTGAVAAEKEEDKTETEKLAAARHGGEEWEELNRSSESIRDFLSAQS